MLWTQDNGASRRRGASPAKAREHLRGWGLRRGCGGCQRARTNGKHDAGNADHNGRDGNGGKTIDEDVRRDRSARLVHFLRIARRRAHQPPSRLRRPRRDAIHQARDPRPHCSMPLRESRTEEDHGTPASVTESRQRYKSYRCSERRQFGCSVWVSAPCEAPCVGRAADELGESFLVTLAWCWTSSTR